MSYATETGETMRFVSCEEDASNIRTAGKAAERAVVILVVMNGLGGSIHAVTQAALGLGGPSLGRLA